MAERKARELVVPRLPVDFDSRYERHIPDRLSVETDAIRDNTAAVRGCFDDSHAATYRSNAEAAAAGHPTFLNRTADILDGERVRWDADALDDLPALWRLKLYAFEPLTWVVYGYEPTDEAASGVRESYDRWIDDWIDTIEVGGASYLRRQWTPWAVSLRIQAWLRYLAWREARPGTGDRSRRRLRREIYKNALFLRTHIERDVGGNHLIENGAALAVAGIAFEDAATDWFETGVSILKRAAEQQFLADGCHFERSPMYHTVTLTRYLTVRDLLRRTGRSVPDSIEDTATAATAFLADLRPPNGRIPLLNDSVYGQALPLDVCLRYAEAIGVTSAGQDGAGGPRPDDHPPDEGSPQNGPVGRTGHGTESSTRTSGLHWHRTDLGAMLVDGGSVGPPHLPGHSHSDTLSVLLWLDGRPIITDTGTYEYERGPRRQYARSVRGHNTVRVGTSEPIPLGGKYLMGPSPEPTTRFRPGRVSLFEGVYTASPLGGPTYSHHRAVYAGDTWWAVRDTVTDHGSEPVRSRLHLHPSVEPSEAGPAVVVRVGGDADGAAARIRPFGHADLATAQRPYFPKFGVETARPVLEILADASGDEETAFGFVISRPERDPIATDGPTAASGRMPPIDDGVHSELPEPQLRPSE